MNSQSWSTLAIFGFVILGTICLELRREAISRDEAAREDTFWELSYDAKFESVVSQGPEQSQLKLAVPFDTRHCLVDHDRENSTVTNPKLHSKVTRPYSGTGNRMLVLSTRQSAACALRGESKVLAATKSAREHGPQQRGKAAGG